MPHHRQAIGPHILPFATLIRTQHFWPIANASDIEKPVAQCRSIRRQITSYDDTSTLFILWEQYYR